MTMNFDPFRPSRQPAQIIYDTFQAEAQFRKGRALEEWQRKEVEAVFFAACKFASDNGLRAPTMEEVLASERYARGSVDYGAKWAYVLSEKMSPLIPKGSRAQV
ncbi:hypothetical protein [Acidovorax sp.]|uniref:hypothetical protein n=1 Tax=Acidovorax sp. TaxID=1872122 RepID=UPI00391F8784